MEPVGHAAKLLSDLPARADAAVVANDRAVFKDSVHKKPSQDEVNRFNALLEAVHQRCLEYGLNYTSDMAKRIIDKQSRSRKSAQGDKWSFCLMAGTLCPANQERP